MAYGDGCFSIASEGTIKIHAISTGTVQITQNWRTGMGTGPWRLVNTLLDPNRTEWLPIFCYVIEHPEGLIVIDTGIQASVNAPVFFPPWMRLVQRAARFRISPDEEIGPQFFVGYCPKQGNDLRSRI